MIPSRISGCPNSALSDATIMSHASASSQPPPSAYPETAATSGVRIAASRGQKRAAGEVSTSANVRFAIALMSAPAANHSSPARDHDAAHVRVLVPALAECGQLLHQLRRQRVARLGAVEASQADGAAGLRGDAGHRYGTSALMPVTDLAMISFWIWDVPS